MSNETIHGIMHRVKRRSSSFLTETQVKLRLGTLWGLGVKHPKHFASGSSEESTYVSLFIDLGEKETSTSWEARHQVSGLMRITKLTRWSWLLAQEGGALPHRRRTHGSVRGGAQDSNVLRPRSERACRRTTAVPFLSELERSHLMH
ncbi:hypothetical protein Salat_2579200 [Sesamum alatum]|uniref:Uncharacterized protein n=1 Tax=Sesamum alatum TaxID=300844 RepID=A0AAE2CA75_9LAMI|nr:hypothetical protein Salat_2579200 [Sesamum alatum]